MTSKERVDARLGRPESCPTAYERWNGIAISFALSARPVHVQPLASSHRSPTCSWWRHGGRTRVEPTPGTGRSTHIQAPKLQERLGPQRVDDFGGRLAQQRVRWARGPRIDGHLQPARITVPKALKRRAHRRERSRRGLIVLSAGRWGTSCRAPEPPELGDQPVPRSAPPFEDQERVLVKPLGQQVVNG